MQIRLFLPNSAIGWLNYKSPEQEKKLSTGCSIFICLVSFNCGEKMWNFVKILIFFGKIQFQVHLNATMADENA